MPQQEQRLFNPVVIILALSVVVIGLGGGFWLAWQGSDGPQPASAPAIKLVELDAKATPLPKQPGPESDASKQPDKTEPVDSKTGLSGNVIVRGTEEPAVGVTVWGKAESTKKKTRSRIPDGSFQFEDFAPGPWVLWAEGEGYAEVHSSFVALNLATGETKSDVALAVVRSVTLAGRVVSVVGKEIPGAKVQIVAGKNRTGQIVGTPPGKETVVDNTRFGPRVRELASQESDENGLFQFDRLEEGNYNLLVSADGYAMQLFANQPTGDPSITLRLEPESRLEGTVFMSPRRSPVPGATITLRCEASGFPTLHGPIIADASGNYSVRGLPRKFQLKAQATHGKSESARYQVSFSGGKGNYQQNLLIVPERRITGRVISNYRQKPIQGAKLLLTTMDKNQQPASETDAEGQFAFSSPRASNTVKIEGPEGYSHADLEANFEGDETSKDLGTIELSLQSSISGNVVDARSKKPAGHATVRMLPLDRLVSDINEFPGVKTEKDGSFSLKNIPPGRYSLSAEKSGYKTGRFSETKADGTTRPGVTIAPGTVMEGVVIEIAPANVVVVEGSVVTPEGAGIEGASVTLTAYANQTAPQQTKYTDAEGKFQFKNIPVGRYSAEAQHSEYWPGGAENVNAVSGTSLAVTITLQKKDALTISGKVMDGEGNPIEDAGVLALMGTVEMLMSTGILTEDGYISYSVIEGPLDGMWVESQSDDGGTYTLHGLQSGKYLVVCSLSGGVYRLKSIDYRYDVDAGASDVDFQLETLTASILGNVFLSDGQTPCTQFTVEAKPVSSGVFMMLSEITDADGLGEHSFSSQDGSFEISGLVEGLYTVTARSDSDGEATLFGIEVPRGGSSESLRMFLNRGGSIIGTVVGPDERPLQEAVVHLGEVTEQVESDGSFEIGGLQPDEYTVIVSHPNYAAHTREGIPLQEGEPFDMGVVTLGEGGTIEGQVRFSDGQGAGEYVIELESGLGYSGASEESPTNMTQTDRDGYYTLPGVEPGEHDLVLRRIERGGSNVVSPQGRVLQYRTAKVREGQIARVDFVIDEGTRYTGNASSNEGPLSGSTLALYPNFDSDLQGYVALTDQWGNFAFDGVTPGIYEAVVGEFSADGAKLQRVTIPDAPTFEKDLVFR